MGVVYKAHDPRLDKDVALKVLNRNYESEDLEIRFQREAKALQKLSHRSIPEIYNLAISRDNEPYMIMEYIEGETLKEKLRKEKRIPFTLATKYLEEISGGLAYAHSHGIVHRDIKPENILIENSGSIKILDFGVAKLNLLNSDNQAVTPTGQLIGTPRYMSPEQLKAIELDGRSDIYSLGCLFFTMLTGKPPFQGESILEILRMKEEEEPASIRVYLQDEDIPEALDEFIKRCLKFEPDDRFQTVTEMMSNLNSLCEANTEQETDEKTEVAEPAVEFKKLEGYTESFQKESSSYGKLWYVVTPILIFGMAYIGFIIFSKTNKKNPSSPKLVRKNQALKAGEIVAIPKDFDLPDLEIGYFKIDGNNKRYSPRDANWVSKENLNELFDKNKQIPVRALSLERVTSLTHEDYKQLSALPISFLDIRRTNVNDVTLSQISKYKNLSHLILTGCEKITDQGIKNLVNSKNLTNLDADHMKFSNKAIKYIASIKKLRRLKLNDNSNIDSNSLKNLRGANQLILLNASRLKTSAPGTEIKSLLRLPNLSILSIDGWTLSDSDINNLASDKNLEYLNLSSTNLNMDQLKRLANSHSLKYLIAVNCRHLIGYKISSIKKYNPSLKIITKRNDELVNEIKNSCFERQRKLLKKRIHHIHK